MLTMKQFDVLPPISISCTIDGAPVDLTTATAIRVIGSRNGAQAFSYLSPYRSGGGIVTAAWQAADTAVAGMIALEVEVTWPGGGITTFPAHGALLINVERGLG